jgi:hypothetical protein
MQFFNVNISGSMPVDQLENELSDYTLRPMHAVTAGVSLREFLERYPGNFRISSDGKVHSHSIVRVYA